MKPAKIDFFLTGDCRHLYERHSIVPIDEVVAAVKAWLSMPIPDRRASKLATFNEQPANLDSLRLWTFATYGCKCKYCGMEATHFALERNIGTKSRYHLNLWSRQPDGTEVIFTHDHKLSRANGGADRLDNTTTSCGPCNWKKGNLERQDK